MTSHCLNWACLRKKIANRSRLDKKKLLFQGPICCHRIVDRSFKFCGKELQKRRLHQLQRDGEQISGYAY